MVDKTNTKTYTIKPHNMIIAGDLNIKDYYTKLTFGKKNSNSTGQQLFGFDNKAFGFPYNLSQSGFKLVGPSSGFGNVNIEHRLTSENIIATNHIETDMLQSYKSNTLLLQNKDVDNIGFKGSLELNSQSNKLTSNNYVNTTKNIKVESTDSTHILNDKAN